MPSLIERAFTPCADHADEWGKLKGFDGSYGAYQRWHYAADHSAEHGRFHCDECNERTLANAKAYALSRANRREPAVRRRWWYEQEGYCLSGKRDKWGRRVYHPGIYGKRVDCPDCWTAMLGQWREAAVDSSRRIGG